MHVLGVDAKEAHDRAMHFLLGGCSRADPPLKPEPLSSSVD